MQREIERTAIFDPSGDYRYELSRRWGAEAEVAFVMLNPSRADASVDDPTLRACIQFAQRWGCGSLTVVNLFGYRTPHPKVLMQMSDPVGPENDEYVVRAVEKAEQVVLAWGNFGGWLERDRTILTLLKPQRHKLRYLQLNRSGHPRHPLYIKRDVPLSLYFAS
ncbi:MAG: DUF1643 domain-containing protein [Cyanobacteria bacterium P01_D01_bin.105]